MKQALLAIATMSAMLATTAAQAQAPLNLEVPTQLAQEGATADPAAEAAAERAKRLGALDLAIEAERSRSRGAVGGIIAGGVIIAIGLIVDVSKTSDNQQEAQEAYDNGESDDPNDYEVETGATLVGVAIGVPVIVGSIVSKSRANRRVQDLRNERARLMMSTGPGNTPTLALNISF